MMKVLQINLHHSKAASAALMLRLSEGADDLVFVLEPWVNGGKVCGLKNPNFKLIVGGEGYPRSCILANSNLNVFLLSKFSSKDITAASMELEGLIYWLTSAYFAYDDPGPLPSEDVVKMIEEADRAGHHVIMCCDSNAHNTIWGSTDTNDRGESLLEFVISTNLIICNRGNAPTFVTSNRQEVLDVTFASDTLSGRIRDWRVGEEHSFSDHRYIEFSLDAKAPAELTRRNYRKTNWVKYRNTFGGLLNSVPSFQPQTEDDIDLLVDRLTGVFNESLDNSCPMGKPRGKKKPPWWTKELQISRKSCRKLFNRAKGSRADEDWAAYRDQLRIYKREIRVAKCESWRRFCGDIENVSESSRLRKILASSPCTLGYLRGADGEWTTSSSDSLSLLLDKHFPGNSTTGQGMESFTLRRLGTDPGIVSESRLSWAIKGFSPYKSPGPDGIIPAELQHVSDLIIPFLLRIFTGCIVMAYVPLRWRDTKVIFIPKSGKISHTAPGDFRPISLSSFLLKTLERMIDLYQRETIDLKMLSARQHAYSKGRSTETALHELVRTIEKLNSVKE